MKSGYIGLDIGSTATKGVLLSGSGVEVCSSGIRTRIDAGDGVRFEEDPAALLTASNEVIAGLAQMAKSQGIAIRAIALTGQMHGGLLVDERRIPLTPFVTWQDKRADAKFEDDTLICRLRSQAPESAWLETGGRIYTGFLGATLYAMRQTGELPTAAKSTLLSIYDWIGATLSGRVVTDPSTAASWGIYSVMHSCWQSALCMACGISESMLPRVLVPGEVIGTILPERSVELGLPDDVAIVAGFGDTQASFRGSGCGTEEALINFGTGSQLIWLSKKWQITHDTDIRYYDSDHYLVTIPTLAGGSAYAVMMKFFRSALQSFGCGTADDRIYQRMGEILETSTGSEGLKLSPLFNGSRALGEELRGRLTGISRDNLTLSNLLHSTLEGMVEELASPYDRIGPSSVKALVASGNAARRNPALLRVIESRFGLPVELSAVEEEAAVGAAMLAKNGYGHEYEKH